MLRLPKKLSHDRLGGLLPLFQATAGAFDCELDLDCSSLQWVDPAGLCLLRFFIEILHSRDVRVTLIGLSRSAEAYMRRMDLFVEAPHLLFDGHTDGYRRNRLEDRLVEVSGVSDAGACDETAARIARTVVAQIRGLSCEPDPEGMRPSEVERADNAIAYVFTEILDNALTHGRRRGYVYAHAKVAAQYFPSRNRLQIAIADNGCGLLESLRSLPEDRAPRSDAEAIRLALQPRVSCNRDLTYAADSVNQGIGLTVSSELALASGGEFTIWSGCAGYNRKAGGAEQVWVGPCWQGTCVVLEFCTQRLTEIEVAAVVSDLPGFRKVDYLNFSN